MKVFVSHGHDELAKLKLKQFLSDRLGHTAVILGEQVGRQGLTIIEALEQLSTGSEFAIILLTGDDTTTDGERRARQNVIHEIGFFQGRLGRTRVVLIIQRGVEIPSNLAGLFYLSYEREIEQTFSDLCVILESGSAASSAAEVGRDDGQLKTQRFDWYFPRVQTFQQEILAFKAKAGEIFARANDADGDTGVKLILDYDVEQGKLFASYLIARNLLEDDLLEKAQSAHEGLVNASNVRSRAQDKEWLASNMKQAMQDRASYEQAFDAFVKAISEAFENQARRLRL
jgi:hypothetical protein